VFREGHHGNRSKFEYGNLEEVAKNNKVGGRQSQRFHQVPKKEKFPAIEKRGKSRFNPFRAGKKGDEVG